jgi:glycerophosphodiester phosphodiesterase
MYDVGSEAGIFMTLHANIQPHIPVLFLTESGSSFMVDIRASSLQQAIRFSTRWNLLGIVSECSVFKCFRLVRYCLD